MPTIEKIAHERALLNETIRSFLKEGGYLEVETPLFVRSPDLSPNLKPFEMSASEPDGTKHRGALITSPEFSMKKLLGIELKADDPCLRRTPADHEEVRIDIARTDLKEMLAAS